jgi:hypothetical protein
MSKVYLKVTLNVCVDTDLCGADNIVDNLDFDVTPSTENVEVYDTEVDNYYITDAK